MLKNEKAELSKDHEGFLSEFLFEQVWTALLEQFIVEKGFEKEFEEWSPKEKFVAVYEEFQKGINSVINQKIVDLRMG
ncbi:hypothetical protein ES703_60618 [subsurface metagenome]